MFAAAICYIASLTTSNPAAAQIKTYDRCTIIINESGGQKYIAVKSPIINTFYVTTDLPFGMRSRNVPSGIYFCERGLVGGIREFIDDEGNLWQLPISARWQQVRD